MDPNFPSYVELQSMVLSLDPAANDCRLHVVEIRRLMDESCDHGNMSMPQWRTLLDRVAEIQARLSFRNGHMTHHHGRSSNCASHVVPRQGKHRLAAYRCLNAQTGRISDRRSLTPTPPLNIAADLKVYLHREAIDFRKSINGLAVLVAQSMGRDPFAGATYVFRNRHCDRIELLMYDRTGFWLRIKRLEQDRFVWPRRSQAVLELSSEELHWLLEGIDLEAVRLLTPTPN